MKQEHPQECAPQTPGSVTICAIVEERSCGSSALIDPHPSILTLPSEPELNAPSFAGVPNRRRGAAVAFSASALLHVLIALFLPFVLRSLPPDADRVFSDRLRPSLQAALILRLPDRIYLSATNNPPADGASAAPSRDQSGTAPMRRESAGADSSSTRLQSRAPSQTILIQPGKPIADDPRANRLPSLLFSPGSKASVPWGLVYSGIQPGAQREEPPLLPVAQGVEDAALVAPATEAQQANDLDVPVLSISPALPQARQLVEIPPVNQLTSSQVAQSTASLPGLGGVGLPTAKSIAPPGLSKHSTMAAGTGEQRGALAVSNKPLQADVQPAVRPGVSQTLPFAPSSARRIKTSSGMVTVFDLPDGTQQLRFPPAGFFDVVIVESSSGATIPEAERLLTGHPIQTVFLTLGTDQDWILQYCLPGDGSGTGQEGMVVTLRGVPKLEPPFIQQAVVPARRAVEAALPALFHGVLGVNGRFARLRPIVDAAHQPMPELLPYLEQWQFRPVKLDGTPTEVEILLLIPPHKQH